MRWRNEWRDIIVCSLVAGRRWKRSGWRRRESRSRGGAPGRSVPTCVASSRRSRRLRLDVVGPWIDRYRPPKPTSAASLHCRSRTPCLRMDCSQLRRTPSCGRAATRDHVRARQFLRRWILPVHDETVEHVVRCWCGACMRCSFLPLFYYLELLIFAAWLSLAALPYELTRMSAPCTTPSGCRLVCLVECARTCSALTTY